MGFEAKSLRVQLPCGAVTVFEAAEADVEKKARQALRRIVDPRFDDDDDDSPKCARATGEEDCIRGSADLDLAHLTDRLCLGTEPIAVRTVVEAAVLPTLRRQLEERLQEIARAEEEVARRIEG